MAKSVPEVVEYDTVDIGEIINVDGARISVAIYDQIAALDGLLLKHGKDEYIIGEVGSIVSVPYKDRTLYAFVASVEMLEQRSAPHVLLHATLFGEKRNEPGAIFERGVSKFPVPLTPVHPASKSDLAALYDIQNPHSIHLGEYRNTDGIPCYIDLNTLLTQPSAVMGTTGTGKSASVAAIVHGILRYGKQAGLDSWKPRILILDPHGEYSTAFPGACRLSSTDVNFNLPYWLFDLHEMTNLLVDPNSPTALQEGDIVRRAMILARREFAADFGYDPEYVTPDSPIPFRLGESRDFNDIGRLHGNVLYTEGLIGKINMERPVDQNKERHLLYNRLIQKIELLKADVRLAFLMREPEEGTNPLPEILRTLVGELGQPVVVDLSAMQSEIAGLLSAAIARVLFNLRIWQTAEERRRAPMLIICEEAHRYIPSDDKALYRSAREAIRRIAKEGRKYGLGLMLVSQRPDEIDTTVLSQCTSWLVLRIANRSDLNQVRLQLPDAFAALADILSGLQQREAIFAGTAARVPASIKMRELKPDELPASQSMDFIDGWQEETVSEELLSRITHRWVQQSGELGLRAKLDEILPETPEAELEAAQPAAAEPPAKKSLWGSTQNKTKNLWDRIRNKPDGQGE